MKETRLKKMEFRALEENEEMTLEGYAIVFNEPEEHYGFTEMIDAGALDDANMKDVPLKYNHDDAHPVIARTRNNSLTLEVDDKGLKIRAKLIDTTANKDIFKMVKSGLLDKMSFAFDVKDEEYDAKTNVRKVKKIGNLYDVSIVDVPFYSGTSVYARGLDTSKDYFEARQKEQQEEERKRTIEKLERIKTLSKLI